MGASPAYPVRHKGAVLVCGSAFCLPEDYARARRIFPDAPVIAVKDASCYVPSFALFGLHPAKMPRAVAGQLKINNEFTTHMSGSLLERTRLGGATSFRPDYWWPGCTEGSSAWGARRMAAMMGFDTVVLCGAPLVQGGYIGGKISTSFRQEGIVKKYKDAIMRDVDFHAGVHSMSGWTREVFGAPA